MRSKTLQRAIILSLGAMCLAACPQAKADVAPPVEIRMSLDEMSQAVSGEEYAGVFEVHVHRPGRLADFRLMGDGWKPVSLETPGDPISVQPGTMRIPFRAVPSDADEPVGLSLTYNGRRVAKSAALGPKHYARANRPREAIRVDGTCGKALADTKPANESEDQSVVPSVRQQRDSSTLRVVGRIMYYRSDMVPVGADTLDVSVWDNDDIGHDVIWSGYTDVNGYFDTGVVTPEDDPGGPDLIVYCETEIANVVDVTDNSWEEYTYSWETPEVEDFSGSYYDFGWLTVPSEEMPALHIFNSIVRTRRFITTQTVYQPPKVQVEWPDNSDGDSEAWYEYYTDMAEIHISTGQQWNEATHSHEYGHHFMHVHSCPECPPDPDYCSDPSCDPNPAEGDCGHCLWCQENEWDAWNEGWPDWLADAVTRSLPWDYQFDDGSPYEPLFTLDLETLGACDDSGLVEDPYKTEGFIGALLRDIEDGVDLDGGSLNDDHDGDGIMDSLCLGPEPLLVIQAEYDPITIIDFIEDFRNHLPEYADNLWPTAINTSWEYWGLFPHDEEPPGAVPFCHSQTHPTGTGGPSPCITISWQQAEDDVAGVCNYSYQWSQNPDVGSPDQVAEPVAWAECFLTVTDGPFNLGDWYVSILAQDCTDKWGADHSVWGPFTVTDCNENGILDVCEISCDLSTLDLPCNPDSSYCGLFWPETCGKGVDCNDNLVPDGCDIASGTSQDCNLNAIPDECENMYHWSGTSGSWHSGSNWLEGTSPTAGAEVCIDVPGSQTITYSTGSGQIAGLSCSENLTIQGTAPPCTLIVTDASFVRGDLLLGNNNTRLQVDDRLDIDGMFLWTGSATLTGAGKTYSNGGAQISDIVFLDTHRLVFDGNSTSVGDGRVELVGASVFEIRPGSTYEHQGGRYFLNGWFDDNFVNGGTLIKSVDTGESVIYTYTNNSGLIHVQTGTLKFYLGGGSSGDFLADPGAALDFTGGHVFLPGSGIVADNVFVSAGISAANTVRGTYNVAIATTVQDGQGLIFTDEANIVGYGSSFYIPRGNVAFNAVVGGTIQFDTLQVGAGASGYAGTAHFNSGDPVQVANLDLGPGTIDGTSDITIDGLLTWNTSGGFSGPGTINANGDVLVKEATGEKWLSNCTFNNAGTATFLGQFTMSSSAVFNNLSTGVIDIQIDGIPISGLGQTLDNAGTMVKSAGTGVATIIVPTTNTGTVEVQAGVLSFNTNYSGYYVQTAGKTVLNGGDLLMSGPAPLQINGGLLTGTGTITGTVVNAGGLVDLPMGTLIIDGS